MDLKLSMKWRLSTESIFNLIKLHYFFLQYFFFLSLKLANILKHDGLVKIADLGFAKEMKLDYTNTVLGTPMVFNLKIIYLKYQKIKTMAPEVLLSKPYGFKADIYR